MLLSVTPITRVRPRWVTVSMARSDLATAARADRIAVMDDGRIVEAGAAGRVLGAREHPRTGELVAADRSFGAVG